MAVVLIRCCCCFCGPVFDRAQSTEATPCSRLARARSASGCHRRSHGVRDGGDSVRELGTQRRHVLGDGGSSIRTTGVPATATAVLLPYRMVYKPALRARLYGARCARSSKTEQSVKHTGQRTLTVWCNGRP